MKQLIEPLTGSLPSSATTNFLDIVPLMDTASTALGTISGFATGGNSSRGGVGLGFGSGGNTSRGTGNNSDSSGESASSGTGFGSGGNSSSGSSGIGFGSGGNPDRGTHSGSGFGSGGNPDHGAGSGQGNGEGGGDGTPDHGDDTGNPGSGNGDGSGDGDGVSDKPDAAPTPPDVLVQDPATADWVSNYTFTLDDITLNYDGLRLGDYAAGMDMTTTQVTKDGVELHPLDSAFGFHVTDFVGAVDKEIDGDYSEGWAGELAGGGISVADSRTDTFSTPARMGTWLEGIGGDFVKASTEHYSVMQAVLSDQAYPGDESGYYHLDDDLWIVDYLAGADGMPVDADGNPSSSLVEGNMNHFYLKELVEALGEAESNTAPTEMFKDFDRDGVDDVYSAYMADVEIDGVVRNVAAVDIGNDGTIDYHDDALNGFGTYGVQDVLVPNESTIIENIAVGDDYSITVKDDGKLLYRWGNAIKRPNDIRIDAKMELPDDWSQTDPETGLNKLYHVTAAELVVNHTVTNNPNDQIRPEDFENEAAIGQLPSFIAVRDPMDASGYEDASGAWVGNVLWVATGAYYTGDGDFLAAYLDPDATSGTVVEGLDGAPVGYLNVDAAGDAIGTVLRDFSLIDAAADSTLADIGAQSADLTDGYTEAWYTTMDREPFTAVLNEDGDYEIGPRWRLQPDKYGQDLPSVTIPQDPSEPLPISNGDEKYETGVDTTTVLNLLDWDGTSPLSLSAGWMSNSGEVSINGVNMTEDFDLAYYVKGDTKPVNLYDAQLVISYDEVAVSADGATTSGSIYADVLAGLGNNTFYLSGESYDDTDAQSDIVVIGYGAETAADMGSNSVYNFGLEEDAIGIVGFDLDPDNYSVHITQEIVDEDLLLSLDGTEIATLYNVTEMLEADQFYFA
ncbi:hypothetical protein [Thioclava sp.]|uniref:hypothetical protein n=1 Tax=Thioclava sp. TaxID=1933450 RepID=UPI003AA8A9D7